METNNEPLDQEQFQPAPTAEYDGMVQDDLNARLRSVASWFYWIVGLSLLNSIIAASGADLAFSLGLGITQVVDAIAMSFSEEGASAAQIVSWTINLFILAFFAFLGFMLSRRAGWALWVGIILYGLDSLFFLIGPQLLSLGFHAFVIFKLSQGFSILKETRQNPEAQGKP